MKVKHTKGPWSKPHLSDRTSECNCGHVLAESGQYCGAIATIHWSKDRELENGDNPPLKEAIANAKLISASPLLLSALIKVKELTKSDLIKISDLKFIDDAIKKAVSN